MPPLFLQFFVMQSGEKNKQPFQILFLFLKQDDIEVQM